MKIKKLEIQGFKSFVDKVEMTFPRGIITVVGPNGCGKSNVVDAIRWVMGEQSAKHLRGKLMEDIIFNGSEMRKPVGLAEVSLTFDNSDGIAPAEYGEFNEITVSRKLFRSGDSEYYINKLPCRLKDITELFMDTGVGTRAYSIIEQGKVGAIVTMKPEERRTLIEEAAGITKYKSKKTAALRKVEATQQNLLRVKDVMREVRRQINSLERQAKKAQKYKELREEAREIELSLTAMKYGSMLETLAAEKRKLNEIIDSESTTAASIASKESELEEKRLAALRAEEELRKEQEIVHGTSNRIVEFEQKIAFHEKEIERLGGDETKYSEEITRLKARLIELADTLKTLESERAELSKTEEEESEKLKNSEENFRGVSLEFEEKKKELEKARGEMLHIVTMKSNLGNTITHLQERLEDVDRRLSRKGCEREEALDSLAKAKEKLAALDLSLGALAEEKTSIGGSTSSELERLGELRLQVDAMEKGLNEMQGQIHRSESKLHSLKELKNNYEGLGSGVQSIMERHRETPLVDGIAGIVADFIDVPKEYEKAAGAVLEYQLEYVVVKDRQNGIDAISYLKSGSKGRGTFIASGKIANSAKDTNLASAWKGEGCTLLSKIGVREGFNDLLTSLIANVLLVTDIDEGIRQWDAGFRGTIVTIEGDLVQASGAITGGKGEGGSMNLLQREREIKELTVELAAQKKEMAGASEKKEGLRKNIERAEKQLDELKRREFAKDMEIANLEKDKSGAGQDIRREEERLRIISMEEEQLKKEISEFRAEMDLSGTKLAAFKGQEQEKEEAIKSMQEDISTSAVKVDELREELTKLRIAKSSYTEKRAAIEREIASLSSSKEETLRLLKRDESALLDGKDKGGQISLELSKGKQMLEALLGDHGKLKEKLTEKKNGYDSLAAEIRDMETRLKDLHRFHDEFSKHTSTLKVSVAEKDIELRHLSEGILERYAIELEREHDKIAGPKEGDEEILVSLNSRIEAIGEVNLMALEEHKENVERLTFLEEQDKDLMEAIESLKKTISKINTTSRKRFKNAFEAINEKFTEIFPKLFRGGKASLHLTDENDLLETGVEILAQPPGKKLQNLNLLSGGEKALTAITLIFSIFLVKPSPFCLLDEVDAPLDDANVGRFNALVKEMSKISQVIMITHNKNSIEIGNTLYGVTMEDPGVSKLVSVQLN